ncbi:hypothetical protein [Paenirhodobacter populi]|uniref:Uncharacterized protein n=1 Tax=Paenirhodobacter populi TaxID=2306993 RepID=A0A443JSG4_9RHOB|nr:hypothetical protein [Sinirhodobacter populi]RWR23459.1 hypothetical protein D2T30_03160 [Sinirhodobacter populi]
MADSDARLSDHEWKWKMAAEGKAIYIPGKTAEQIKVEMAATAEGLAQKSARTITMTAGAWSTIDTAIPDVIEMLSDVRNVLHELAYADDLDQPWVNSVMRLSARAMQSMQDKEILVLDQLDVAIRDATEEDAA